MAGAEDAYNILKAPCTCNEQHITPRWRETTLFDKSDTETKMEEKYIGKVSKRSRFYMAYD